MKEIDKRLSVAFVVITHASLGMVAPHALVAGWLIGGLIHFMIEESKRIEQFDHETLHQTREFDHGRIVLHIHHN